jgi:hypothetical protein
MDYETSRRMSTLIPLIELSALTDGAGRRVQTGSVHANASMH